MLLFFVVALSLLLWHLVRLLLLEMDLMWFYYSYMPARTHSIHISFQISFPAHFAQDIHFRIRIRIQHSLELNSARKLNRFCIWKTKNVFMNASFLGRKKKALV